MIQQITPLQLQEKILQGETMALIDVREPWEYEIVSMPNSINVPLGQLMRYCNDHQLPDCVVAICHHGVRSIQACAVLETFGIRDTYSLAGGIDAFARTIDTRLALY